MDAVLCWLRRAGEGVGGPDLAKQVTRSWEPQFPRCSRRQAPPYPPRPSASLTQVTPNLALPRPPSSGPPSPLEKCSRAPRAGTAPGGHWFPQNKSGLHTPCRVPWFLAEATGCRRTSRSDSGTRDRPIGWSRGRPHRTPPRAESLPRTVAHGAALTAPQRAGPAGGRLGEEIAVIRAREARRGEGAGPTRARGAGDDGGDRWDAVVSTPCSAPRWRK